MAESFFSTPRPNCQSGGSSLQAEDRMAGFSYIEGWYNPIHLHSGPGYLHQSPMKPNGKSTSSMLQQP